MTLSVRSHSSLWDRTLPKPMPAPLVALDTYSRRNSSLLQHHVTSDQRLNVESAEAGCARRNTVSCIPLTQTVTDRPLSRDAAGGYGATSEPSESFGPLTRKRHASVMSTETGSRSSSPSSTSPTEGSQFCLCQPEPKIPRPRNAFILYRQHQHTGVVAQNPGLPNPDISKIIGEQWRQLPANAKDEWKALAEEEKVRHSQQYPDYRYKPKRNSRPGGQSSTSGPSTGSAVEAHSTCQKCGGKTMNAPVTPFTPYTPNAPTMPTMVGPPPVKHGNLTLTASQNPRMPHAQHTISPPNSGRVRPYAEVFGPTQPQRHDPRMQYAPIPQQNGHLVVSPDAKRRRFNNGVYVSGRGGYHENQYQYSQQDMTMAPPPRGSLVQPHPSMQQVQVRPPLPPQQLQQQHQQQHQHQQYQIQQQKLQQQQLQQRQRDPSLTLPPLQTPTNRPRATSHSTATQSQKSGIEAMIMSIPVFNKLKILSQIAPPLAGPGIGSPPGEVRGSILAVEGLDCASVMSMTNSLAEHLEREGKFAVRIFGGPDPYTLLGRTNGGNASQTLSNLDFLNIISEWHKISKEMVDYITHKPDEDVHKTPIARAAAVEGDDGFKERATVAETSKMSFSMENAMRDSKSQPSTPPSAVSPKTILQTSELSLRSSPSEDRIGTETVPRAKSRIPAAALVMKAEAQARAKAEAEAKMKIETEAKAQAKKQAQEEEEAEAEAEAQKKAMTEQQTIIARSPSQHKPTDSYSTPVPIALVPRYQLTTVDTSSIAMPITDAYSPHSHWQWLATLWRGCTGPDVTIVLKGPNDEQENTLEEGTRRVDGLPSVSAAIAGSNNNNNSSNNTSHAHAHAHAHTPGPGVEIRLLDCRAVVVRTGWKGEKGNNVVGAKKDGDDEAWKKAKRRVGFEVEEFLRR